LALRKIKQINISTRDGERPVHVDLGTQGMFGVWENTVPAVIDGGAGNDTLIGGG
jgi:hypothetical protein